MDIQKAINCTKKAVALANTDEEFNMCIEAVLKIEKELKRIEQSNKGYIITKNSIFRDYSKENLNNTKLKRLVRG